MIPGWVRSTWIIIGLVVATALTTLLGGTQPELPGILRLGVIEGAGEQRQTEPKQQDRAQRACPLRAMEGGNRVGDHAAGRQSDQGDGDT